MSNVVKMKFKKQSKEEALSLLRQHLYRIDVLDRRIKRDLEELSELKHSTKELFDSLDLSLNEFSD